MEAFEVFEDGLHTRQVTYMTLYTGGSSRFVASVCSDCYRREPMRQNKR